MKNKFTVLFDFDSMVYKSVHKIVDFQKIRSWFTEGKTRDWMETEIMNLSINRLLQMSDGIMIDIEETGINIESVEYFLTACKNSVRKKASTTYKAKRKRNKWVSIVRQHLLQMEGFIFDDEFEADDLIKDRCVELGSDNYVVCSIDKDLKQIEGIHFDYYRPVLKNPDGSVVLDVNGFRKVASCVGLSVVSKEEANKFLAAQMLTGDSCDGVVGLKGIGKVKAGKILKGVNPTDFKEVILAEYVNHFGCEEEGQKQFELHLLLLGLGVKYRNFLE